MTNHRLRFVVLRHSHHSPHSGYSRLAEYGIREYQALAIQARPFSRRILRNRIMWKIANGVIAYNQASIAAELQVAWRMLQEKGNIYHLLYGENTYHYLGLINNLRGNRVVATFHQPPEVLKEHVKINWHFPQLSAVICLGRSQQEYFARFLDQSRIFFVPLGIDTDYYLPPESFDSRDPNICLFVGEHLRDFPTLRGVIELVAYRRPNTRFVAVLRPQSLDLIGKHPNLEIRMKIDESELLNLYRTAALMVLPLRDATANNAVLESLACGLPVISTQAGSTQDYVDPGCSILLPPGDSRAMADLVIELLDDPKSRKEMGENARKHAELFAWDRVVKQLRCVYEAIT
jgi:glycosyltransferase involved in cell wall biosynthesis